MSFYKIFNLSVKKFLKRPSRQNFMLRRTFNEVRFEDIPDVSLSVIKNNLKKYQIAFEDGPTNFVIGCPICEKNGKTKIFINKRTGAFTCESCRHTGSWLEMNSYISAKHEKRKVSKDPIIVCELENLTTYLKAVKKNTNAIGELDDETFKSIKDKFSLPETITKSHLDALGIRLDITHSDLYLPLQNSSNDLVSYKVLNATSSTTSASTHTSISSSIQPKLPNTHSSGVLISKLSKSKTCVLVSNVSDFLVLYAASTPYTVICLPSGLNNLSQHVLPCFERYNKLVIWFGNDLAAWETARNFAKKLGEKRCLFIRPLDKSQLPHKDPSQDFCSIIGSAQPIWHKSITTFASLRQDVLADLKNIDRVQGVKWSRYPSLNRILKGHRRGELTVFTGPTGSGKTTFISEYSLDLAMQGVNTLWGSFEIRNARLARTMLQQLAGIPLDEHLDQYDHWADIFEELPIYYMTFHGQQSIKIVMEAIEHAVYVHDINHVIIDNLQFMMGMSEDTRHMDRFWKQDLIVANFRTFATRRNCHVTLVIHPRKEKEDEELTTSSIFGGAKASQEADNILIIQDKRLASIKGRKYLQICKNRYSGDLGIMPLEFDKASLCFAPKKKKEAKKRSEVVESS